MERNIIKNKPAGKGAGYMLIAIGIALFLPVYIFFPSLAASLFILLDASVFAFGIGQVLKTPLKSGSFYLLWYMVFPFTFILLLWIFLLSPIFIASTPAQYSQETALFPFLISITLFSAGRKMAKIEAVNKSLPRFAMFVTPFANTLLLLIAYALFTDVVKILPLSYGIFFTFIAFLTISFFYVGLDSKNESYSSISGQIVNSQGAIGPFSFLLGLFIGLYIEFSSSPYSIIFLLFSTILVLAGIIVSVRFLYRKTSSKMDNSNITVFKKFEKPSNLTTYSDISNMGKSLEAFESDGAKEQLIISVTKYLTERGMDLEFIQRVLKQTTEYNQPRSLAMGVAKKNSRIYVDEVARRKHITENLLKYLGAVGEKNE